MDEKARRTDSILFQFLFSGSRTQSFSRFADNHPELLGNRKSALRQSVTNRKNYLRSCFLTTPHDIIDQITICGHPEIAQIVKAQLADFQAFHSQQAIDNLKRATPTKESPAVITPIKQRVTPNKFASPTKTTTSKVISKKLFQNKSPLPSALKRPSYKTTTPTNRVRTDFRVSGQSEDSEDESIHSTAPEPKGPSFIKNMSQSSRSTIAVSEEYDLDLANPEMNPGILPLLCPEVKVDGQGVTCTKLYIKVNNVDVEDWQNRYHSARLTEDYSGIEITLPRLPQYDRVRDDVDGSFQHQAKQLKEAPDSKKPFIWYCPKVHMQSLKLVTACASHEYQVRKTIRFNFPTGMKCNNRYFNRASDSFKLTPKIYVTTRDGRYAMKFYCVIYEMAVEGSVTRFAELDEDYEIEALEAVMNGMSVDGA